MLIFIINVMLLRMLQAKPLCSPGDECILLNDGHRMPSIAFGVWTNISSLDTVIPSVKHAIQVGYRHVDTAHLYGNEKLVGQALSELFLAGTIQREDIYITTKLDIAAYTSDMVVAALKLSLERLQVTYVDLFLVHTPYNTFNYPVYDIVTIWNGMEETKDLGLTRSIGLCNFNSIQVNRLLTCGRIRPAVNNINVDSLFTSLGAVSYYQSEGIVVVSYSPLGFIIPTSGLRVDVPLPLDNPILVRIAKKYGKDTSQIAIRYLIDRGIIPLLRSQDGTSMSLYLDVFDFCLTQVEIYTINEMNLNIEIGVKILILIYSVQYEYIKSNGLV